MLKKKRKNNKVSVKSPSSAGRSYGADKIRSLEGMLDISPRDTEFWRAIQKTGEKIAELHHFYLVQTPVVERAELFESALGKNTQLNSQELFTFKAGTRTRMALRPEGVSSVMRSYIQNQLGYFSLPLRAYYHGPMYRKGKKGEQQQFNEWGFEIIGDGAPVYDAEIVVTLLDFLKSLKINKPVLKVNTIGCRVCQPGFRKKLKNFYRYQGGSLCKGCRSLYKGDLMKLLQCEAKKCIEIAEKAPNILNHLCQNCNNHFQNILELIEDNQISYLPDPYLVGDRDYYSKFVFQVFADQEAEEPIASGGRQDYLSERIGGRQLPATGGVIYLDALMKHLKKVSSRYKVGQWQEKVFFIAIGERARRASLSLMSQFRNQGVVIIESLGRKTLSSQLKVAEKSEAELVLIYGQREIFEGTVIIRRLGSGIQENVLLESAVNEVKKRLKKIKKQTSKLKS